MVDQFRGFGSLKTPQDQLAKVQRTLARLQGRPTDSDIASDFFINANNLVDWVYPGKPKPAARKTLEQEPLLELVSHIANRSKHWVVTHSVHRSFKDAETRPPVYDADVFDPAVYQTEPELVVLLKEPTAGYRDEIRVLDLAADVVAWWENWFVSNP
ncbi:MAG: hypothetical protein ABI818_12075 [Acidobacteriota bacterium]